MLFIGDHNSHDIDKMLVGVQAHAMDWCFCWITSLAATLLVSRGKLTTSVLVALSPASTCDQYGIREYYTIYHIHILIRYDFDIWMHIYVSPVVVKNCRVVIVSRVYNQVIQNSKRLKSVKNKPKSIIVVIANGRLFPKML